MPRWLPPSAPSIWLRSTPERWDAHRAPRCDRHDEAQPGTTDSRKIPAPLRRIPGLMGPGTALYETLALFDALRGGAARERNLAAKLLEERFA